MRSWSLIGLVVLTIGLFLAGSLPAQMQPPPQPMPFDPNLPVLPPPRGVEVLGKGPVHEGFARPVDDRPAPGPLVTKEPPALIDELPPDQRPEGSNWIPGYWQWDDERSEYIWISGFWRVAPPGRQWVPGQYQRVEGGYRWVPGFWANVQQTDLTYLPPPPASLEVGPAQPAPQEDATYIPGSWIYQETGYRWRGGFWTQHRPGWVWNPAQYCWTPAGYVFVDGYWDLPLERRGCLFAPAAFAPTVLRPGFVWTPSYVVTHDFLPSALFVRTGHCSYYFGDYYAGRYSSLGFNFWIDFRFGRSCPDPLFGYYQIAHRGRPWERDLRGIYIGRVRGDLPLPPPTLAAQLAPPPFRGPPLVGGRPPMLAPLAPLGPGALPPGLPLARISAPERAALARGADDLRALGVQRGALERGLVERGPPLRGHDAPRNLGLTLPGGGPGLPPLPGGGPALGGRPTPGLNIISGPGNSPPNGRPISTPNLGQPNLGQPNLGQPNLGPGRTPPNTQPPGNLPGLGSPPNLGTRPGGSTLPGGQSFPGGQSLPGRPTGTPNLPNFPGGSMPTPPNVGTRPGGSTLPSGPNIQGGTTLQGRPTGTPNLPGLPGGSMPTPPSRPGGGMAPGNLPTPPGAPAGNPPARGIPFGGLSGGRIAGYPPTPPTPPALPPGVPRR